MARWTVTRLDLIAALRDLMPGDSLEATGGLADTILGRLPAADGDQVTVSAADLVTVLGEAEGFIGGKDNEAFSRLAHAAGVE